jgi:glycerate 2-kinase
LSDAMAAAGAAARTHGLRDEIHSQIISGDAATVGSRLAQELLAADRGMIHIWGGETTVRLPASPGRGGRAQHLALSAARTFAGREGIYLLAAGSDGTDGPTADAGALVDGGTLERGTDGGFNAGTALANADSGSFLEASGDLLQTGPTGTNVMDLMFGLRV